jgi:hypothetical protein
MVRGNGRAGAITELQAEHRALETRVVRTEAALLHMPKREDLDHLRNDVHDVSQRIGRLEAQSNSTLQTVQLISQHLMGVKP